MELVVDKNVGTTVRFAYVSISLLPLKYGGADGYYC